jgi:hypothetical protein
MAEKPKERYEMRRRIATTLAGVALLLGCSAAAPSAPFGGPVPAPVGEIAGATAAVTKSLSGGEGAGNAAGAGQRLGGLLSGWGVPVLIALGGLMLVGSLTQRNIGAAVGVVAVVLVGLIFLLSPGSIESTAKAVANIVF